MHNLMIFMFCALTAFCTRTGLAEPKNDEAPSIAILAASKREIEFMDARLNERRAELVQGREYLVGILNGKSVVLANVGVGKVNAAIGATLAIERFHPRAIVLVGIAGGINERLLAGDVVVAERTVQHDAGTYTDDDRIVERPVRNPVNRTVNPRMMPADDALLSSARRVAMDTELLNSPDNEKAAVVRFGTIASGDTFIASAQKGRRLRHDFNADAVDMEAAAVAQTCWQANVPFISIKGISDAADANARGDLKDNSSRASANASNVALHIIEEIAATVRPPTSNPSPPLPKNTSQAR